MDKSCYGNAVMETELTKTTVNFAFLIHRLYGRKSYQEIKSYMDLPLTRKYFRRMIASIEVAARATLTITDQSHRTQFIDVTERYDSLIRSSKSHDDVRELMIAFQSEIIFLLIGAMPNRWQEENVTNTNRKENWKLNLYRQIQYVQNAEQKKNVIFDAVQNKYRDRFGDWGEFVSSVYHSKCEALPEKLVQWMKEEHPDIYMELF